MLKSGAVPIILLTVNDMETGIAAGPESGADDYIAKLFPPVILQARVNAQFHRSALSATIKQLRNKLEDSRLAPVSKSGVQHRLPPGGEVI